MSPALSGPYPIPQGTAGTMSGTLYDANGQPVPLTLATNVRFGIEPVSPALAVEPRMLGVRVPTDEGVGRFAWDYDPGDVGVAGLFRAQVHMVMPDGPKSFPSDGYLDISVIPQAGFHPAAPGESVSFMGHGPPDWSALPTAEPGDLYIDLDTGDLYELQ